MVRRQGVTLVELLISLLITSVMLAVLINYYLSSKRQYLEAQKALSASYDLQLITELLRNSVRHAGFAPCVTINWLKIYDARNPRHQPVALATAYGTRRALHIERMSEMFSVMVDNPRMNHLLLPDSNFTVKQTILIADCFHGEITRIASMHKLGKQVAITTQSPLHFTFIKPIYVGAWLEEEFFVQKNTQGEMALYYSLDRAEELSNQVQELTAQLLANNNKWLMVLTLAVQKRQPLIIKTALRMT